MQTTQDSTVFHETNLALPQDYQKSIFKRNKNSQNKNFTVVSNAMIQDPSISPKAKGILLYLIHLPEDWVIYHGYLQKAMNVGENYLNSGLDELIEAGYVKRERQKIKGIYQPYSYEFSDMKIFKPLEKNQTGFSSPENPELQNTNKVNTKEHQQQSPISTEIAVVGFSNKKQNSTAKIHKCLEQEEFPVFEKEWLTSHYDETTVINALAFADSVKIKTTRIQTVKFACARKPQIIGNSSINPTATVVESNKKLAQEIEKKVIKDSLTRFEALSKGVEIISYSCGGYNDYSLIQYSDHGFKEQIENAMRKRGIRCNV